MRLRMLGLVALIALLPAGCGTPRPGSARGECQIFTRPATVVLGQTAYDQGWIDDQIESGVAGCGWKRPARRQP